MGTKNLCPAEARPFPAGESGSAFRRLFLEKQARCDFAMVHEELLWKPLHLFREAFLRLLAVHLRVIPESRLPKFPRNL
jgi:hypothetical protein